METVLRHRWWLVLLVPYLYGFLTALIPSPEDASQFWVANFAAPYVAFPVAAAWLLRYDRAWVRLSVVPLSAVALVLGFYRLHAVGWTVSASQLELPPGTSRPAIWWASQELWWRTMTVGNRPWVALAVVVGVVVLAGTWRLGRRGWLGAGALVALLFVLEPVMYLAGANPATVGGHAQPLTATNLVLWVVPAVAGLVVAILFLGRLRRESIAPGVCQSRRPQRRDLRR